MDFAKCLNYETKFPILIEKGHLSELMLRWAHEHELKHVGGPTVLLMHMNRRYFILKGRYQAKQITQKCVICQKHSATPKPQRMSPLPEFRTPFTETRLAPFESTGVDLAGPFLVKQGRAAVKRWLLLLTCARYRCIHLEMVYSLSTESFIMAFTRFLSRRPRPKLIISDNGTNFCGANNHLLKIYETLADDLKEQYPAIIWKFLPPYTPHQGGFYESLIKDVKNCSGKNDHITSKETG